ncbi:hypothetical protein GCM10010399_24970 [Dactylosporangium fulvum]|uniref:Uncharacterized protein n=1 Tax=Dactylosporangium fulvum TaxID=53359 RepID=A0ABY5W9V0_9ACTN|nr:hypothetical protein [Dactylosporangium fulvum]UWP85468.1 hypothetical protein Dfulv_14995 [Dactylosporangium fulvum]
MNLHVSGLEAVLPGVHLVAYLAAVLLVLLWVKALRCHPARPHEPLGYRRRLS